MDSIIPSQQCAYCGRQDKVLTKEHLFPKCLHQRLQQTRETKKHSFWLSRLDKTITTEPQIRDVCNICNSGELSRLDSYICTLWDRFFSRIYERDDTLTFSFDYHLLCRWLLKQCFNSARIHGFDEFVYPPLTSYIMGTSTSAANVRLFLQLVPPGYISVQELAEMGHSHKNPLRWEPESHRVGFIQFLSNDGRKKLLRAIHLRSFSFFLAFFEPNGQVAQTDEFVNIFMSQNTHIKLLKPELNRIKLVCEGVDAWSSFREARTNKLLFR